MFSMYFLLHFIIYLEKPACTLICGPMEYIYSGSLSDKNRCREQNPNAVLYFQSNVWLKCKHYGLLNKHGLPARRNIRV
jgi:hypothetical protein